MIVVSKSGTLSVEYHGSFYETHQLTDGRVHLWVWGIDGQAYDVYASEDVTECRMLHKAMITAASASKPVFSVSTRLAKIAKERPASEPIIKANNNE